MGTTLELSVSEWNAEDCKIPPSIYESIKSYPCEREIERKEKMESELSPSQKLPVRDEIEKGGETLEEGANVEEVAKEKIEVCLVKDKEGEKREELILPVWEEDIEDKRGRREFRIAGSG